MDFLDLLRRLAQKMKTGPPFESHSGCYLPSPGDSPRRTPRNRVEAETSRSILREYRLVRRLFVTGRF